MSQPKILDNFLDKKYFNELYELICGYGAGGPGRFAKFEWFYGADVVSKGSDTIGGGWAGELQTTADDDSTAKDNVSLLYLLTNLIYVEGVPRSQHYNAILPFIEKIKTIEGEEFKSLLRIRANFFGNTHTLHEHPMHTDYAFPHTAALLSLNTCDGYTKLADGTKIDSVANRLVLFDAGEDHCSTTTTNAKARFNLIVNYL